MASEADDSNNQRHAAQHRQAKKLLQVLDLTPVPNELPFDERRLFRGANEEREGRLFGGQVLGQVLRAASLTVPDDRQAHSLHAYFLRGGQPHSPVNLTVETLRDGRSFSVRRVDAVQSQKVICTVDASFQISETGVVHDEPMPTVPSPEALLAERARVPEATDAFDRARPFELLPVFGTRLRPRTSRGDFFWDPVWIRFAGNEQLDSGALDAPLSPQLARCVLAYASDMGIVSTGLWPHAALRDTMGDSRVGGGLQVASLDHALWIHQTPDWSDWLLFAKRSINASGARTLNRASFYNRHGVLIASCTQEGLVRLRTAADT